MVEPILKDMKPALILFRGDEDADSAFQKTFEEAASVYKGKIIFLYSGITEEFQASLA